MSILACFCTSSLATAAIALASHTSTTCATTSPCPDSVFLVRSRISRARSQRDTEAPDSSNRVATASQCPAPLRSRRHVFPSSQFRSPALSSCSSLTAEFISCPKTHTSANRGRELCTALLADCPVNRARDASRILLRSKQASFQGDDQQPKENWNQTAMN